MATSTASKPKRRRFHRKPATPDVPLAALPRDERLEYLEMRMMVIEDELGKLRALVKEQ